MSGGRQKIPIDTETVERSASIGCTLEEIATICGVSRKTLFNRLVSDPEMQEAIERGRDAGKSTLRRLQWERAHSGSDTMLIWLGKQLLGQRDKQEYSGEVANNIRVVVELVGGPPPAPEIEHGPLQQEKDR